MEHVSSMFGKQVWYDTRHRTEVIVSDNQEVIGTIVAYEGAVLVVNPRAEILSALYQESRLKRLLGLKGVVLTSTSVENGRGICALVNYSRVLRRTAPLALITLERDPYTTRDFISRCCEHLFVHSGFELDRVRLRPNVVGAIGKGEITFVPAADAGFVLQISTAAGRVIHYYDDSIPVNERDRSVGQRIPDLVVRAAEFSMRPTVASDSLLDILRGDFSSQ